MEMFRYYHSPELLIARAHIWKYLKSTYIKNPVTFDQLFSTELAKTEIYNDLAKILYFWMSFYVLKTEKSISVPLAQKLFSIQYHDWEDAIKPLYEKTLADSDYRADWFIFIEDGEMDWIK